MFCCVVLAKGAFQGHGSDTCFTEYSTNSTAQMKFSSEDDLVLHDDSAISTAYSRLPYTTDTISSLSSSSTTNTSHMSITNHYAGNSTTRSNVHLDRIAKLAMSNNNDMIVSASMMNVAVDSYFDSETQWRVRL